MLDSKKYIISSLELHLFFARIMKEHSIFLEAGFTPKNSKLSKEANGYKIQFEKLLLDTIRVSEGRNIQSVINSGEIFTKYTLNAEKKTQYYTGININSKITLMEQELKCKNKKDADNRTVKYVRQLNNRAIKLIECLIDLKMRILDGMLFCELFTLNYPSLIEHIIHEAKLYHSYIKLLENGEDIEDYNNSSIRKTELFWDEIMMEHTLFIRGLLDPSENKLIDTSDKFADDYNELIKKTSNMTDMKMSSITNETLIETTKLKEFKEAGVGGIIDCKIKSIILPLLADHVLREANHYIRLLNNCKKLLV